VYDRAASLYQALHDVMGEERFQQFLRDYYATWQFRHVDRWAMQRVAEGVYGAPLGWFFDQWVTRVGVIDYALRAPRVRREVGPDGAPAWVVTATLVREGGYRHPMPVGVRTRSGWAVVRADPAQDVQEVRLRTTEPPDALWLDPHGATDAPSARYYRFTLSAPLR
jgi:aminopeptidase N